MGRTTLSGPTMVNRSNIGRVWLDISSQLKVAGSCIRDTVCPMRNVPPRFAMGSTAGNGNVAAAMAGAARPAVA